MARTVAIGNADFEDLITNNDFYVDKTNFIKEWWENRDIVTLITRPRRFGKTLTMNMVERFFSVKYAGKREVFENLNIWKEEKFQKLQGTIPVINLTFAGIKCDTYEDTVTRIKRVIIQLFEEYEFLKNSIPSEWGKNYFHQIFCNMSDMDAVDALHNLCKFLQNYYKKR